MIAISTNASREARQTTEKKTDTLVRAARAKLESSDLFRRRLKTIRIQGDGEKIILEGRLPTYYLKQMLQTILREVKGIRSVENRISVDWPQPD